MSELLHIKEEQASIQVECPTPLGERRRQIRLADWNRLKREINEISNTGWFQNILQDASWCLIGIGIACLLNLTGINKEQTSVHYFLNLISGISAIIIGFILMVAHFTFNKNKKKSVSSISSDINEIEQTFINSQS